jgi:ABC-type transport system involved in multi-copper enzyme maturation permease subunit
MKSVNTLEEYEYADAKENLAFSFDIGKARKVAFSVPSLLALALFLGVSYFAHERANKLTQALIVSAVAWGIFVLVKSATE